MLELLQQVAVTIGFIPTLALIAAIVWLPVAVVVWLFERQERRSWTK